MVDDSKYQYSSLNLALGVDIYDTEDATLLSWLQTNVIQGNEQTQALMVVSDGGNISTESDSGQPSNIASLSSASPSGATTQVALPELSLAPRYPWLLSSFSNMARFQQSGSHENYDLARPNELSLHAVEQPNEHNISELVKLSHDAEFADDASVIDLDNRVSDSSLRFTLKKGADTGNLLHDILENVDFVEPNWEEAGAPPLAKYLSIMGNNFSSGWL
jgi:exodeoxyribonuclease V beta subunit